MSETLRTPLVPADSSSAWRETLRRRWPWYAGAAAFALLALAYFDGGEEPIRPIVQAVALPTADKGTN